ncbi:MAG: response regulator [Planctomycetota bacterium]|jgi:CheY-like chemotaxis protein
MDSDEKKENGQEKVRLTAEGAVPGRPDCNETILITDDSRAMRALACRTLESSGYNTLEASNGLVAIAVLKEQISKSQKVDLVLLDINMPTMNGLTCLRKIREDPALRSIPVLIMSTDNDRKNIMMCMALKVAGYILKPYTTEKLLSEVRMVFSSGGTEMEGSSLDSENMEAANPDIEEGTLAHLLEMIDDAMMLVDENGEVHGSDCPVAKKLRQALNDLKLS